MRRNSVPTLLSTEPAPIRGWSHALFSSVYGVIPAGALPDTGRPKRASAGFAAGGLRYGDACRNSGRNEDLREVAFLRNLGEMAADSGGTLFRKALEDHRTKTVPLFR